MLKHIKFNILYFLVLIFIDCLAGMQFRKQGNNVASDLFLAGAIFLTIIFLIKIFIEIKNKSKKGNVV